MTRAPEPAKHFSWMSLFWSASATSIISWKDSGEEGVARAPPFFVNHKTYFLPSSVHLIGAPGCVEPVFELLPEEIILILDVIAIPAQLEQRLDNNLTLEQIIEIRKRLLSVHLGTQRPVLLLPGDHVAHEV